MEKPHILSVKPGYNPNSSSIGMMVKVFLLGAFALNIFVGIIHILITFKLRKKNKKEATV